MRYYNIKLRLLGALHHEVRRQKVSAAEVILLNAIHGGAAVTEATLSSETPYSNRDHRIERRRLEKVYGQDGIKEKHLAMIRDLFGASAGPLPESVSMDDLAPLPEEVEDLDSPFESHDPGEAKPAEPKGLTPIATKAETLSAQEALKDSIRKLGGTIPRGVTGVTKLRAILGELQIAANAQLDGLGDATGEVPEPEPASVLGD